MDYPMMQSIWTVVVLVIFVGIVLWAWSGKRKKDFDEAANIPFSEDDKPIKQISKENSHG